MGAGPLAGVKIVEIAGIGPAPYAAMLLADLGADVLRIERKQGVAITRQIGMDASKDSSNRSRPSIAVDLKHAEGAALVLDLASDAAALIEGFRPGVMERLGLGPDVCMARNPRLVYGRMTGWGQTGRGPRAQATTSITSRSPGCCTPLRALASVRCHRATQSAIWAVGA